MTNFQEYRGFVLKKFKYQFQFELTFSSKNKK